MLNVYSNLLICQNDVYLNSGIAFNWKYSSSVTTKNSQLLLVSRVILQAPLLVDFLVESFDLGDKKLFGAKFHNFVSTDF